MAILEEEVWVGLGGGVHKHYESLGYDVPRVKSTDGVFRIKRGTQILVNVMDLPKGSGIKLTKICDICDKNCGKQQYCEILLRRKNGDGKDRCFNCGRDVSALKLTNNVLYENSLEYFALTNDKEYLLMEFSDKNEKSPKEISFGSEYEYLWNCPDCKCEYNMSAYLRKNNTMCPYCTGKRVNNTNNLATTHPNIAKLLKNKQRGFEITPSSSAKEVFLCEDCGFEQVKIIYNVTRQGFSCSRCSDGISYPEKFMMSVLGQLKIDFKTEKTFKWSNKRRYDFYIPSMNVIIEAHGKQHYNGGFGTYGGRSLIEETMNDVMKKHMAISNGYNYITIDCRESDLNHIKDSLISSELSKIVKLDTINWVHCHEFACSSLVKDVCEMWEMGVKSTLDISDKLNLEKSTVLKCLKQGSILGWCSYNVKEIKFNIAYNMSQKNKKTVMQFSTSNDYIKTWNSATEAELELGIYRGGVSGVCRGDKKTAGGFKWIYKEDYEEQLNELITK